ncbi:hypothetical protein [Limisalsivibrio acetivorans]|uniref:hypothetical protein n=1 Tax=Limisalsivibrio acetivorans TaxID=1304888 RepID=UPI0003B5E708|nr:hypothetical protein [Limisalsivibrio acetivorans]
MKTTKLIRAKQKLPGDRERVFAYCMITTVTQKMERSESISVEILPIVKDELISNNDEFGEKTQQEEFNREKHVNRFSARADYASEIITITHGAKMMLNENIRGYGIGTFAFNEIIRWMIMRYPNYLIDSIHLNFLDVPTESARERAVRFLENFGFRFEFDKGSNEKGRFNVPLALNLHEHHNRTKVDELDIAMFIRQLLIERYQMEDRLRNQTAVHNRQEKYMDVMDKDKFISILLNVVGALVLLMLFIYFT